MSGPWQAHREPRNGPCANGALTVPGRSEDSHTAVTNPAQPFTSRAPPARPPSLASSPVDPRQRLGRTGEDLVCRRLRSRGWRIVERNARTRYGELDLVAMTPDRQLVFVEVKTRRSGGTRGPATPAESVGPAKARRIRQLAAAWLQGRPGIGATAIRFDVAGVEVAATGGARLVQYIEGAF